MFGRHQWFRIHWPTTDVDVDAIRSALSSLNGYSTRRRSKALRIMAVGRGGVVSFYLAVPVARADGTRGQLEAHVPGLVAEAVDEIPDLRMDRAWRTWLSSRDWPLATATKQPESVARSIIAALGAAEGDDEALVLRWVLGPVRRPVAPGHRRRDLLAQELSAQFNLDDPQGRIDTLERTARVRKSGVPGWRAALHIGVRASGRRRQRQLLGRLAGAIRAAQAPGVQAGFRPARRSAPSPHRGLPARRPLLVNVDELTGLVGWPIGTTLTRGTSPLLPPSEAVPRGPRVICQTTYPGGERLYALPAADALHHLHVIGPTGTGKTTLLLQLICQDMAAGRSVVVIEPTGDLVHDVLARVPEDRLDDVVVIDPTETQGVVGINPIAANEVSADLRVDHILAVFRHLWAENIGPRTHDILTASLLTLTTLPNMTLVDLPRLLTDDDFRRQEVLPRIYDPALVSFWTWFENCKPRERYAALQPVMNKLRAFWLRPPLRRVLGQESPRFDLRDIHRESRIVLVNVAEGAIGPESSGLLGALVVSQIWQSLLGRGAGNHGRRRPVMLFVDEFQQYLHLPTDLGDVLARARGLGVGLTLAHQHLGQLSSSVQEAVLANARSQVVFAARYDDARTLLRDEPRIEPGQVAHLEPFGVLVSLLANGRPTPWATGRTLPPPPECRAAEEVRRHSRDQWARPVHEVDQASSTMPPALDKPSRLRAPQIKRKSTSDDVEELD